MSGPVLSDDRVADLVAAAKAGSLPAPAVDPRSRRTRRVRDVDFRRPSKFTSEQQRQLERAHDTFCRTASTRLSAELRVPIELEVIDVVQLTWANALDEVPDNSISAVVEVSPLRTRFLMSAELALLLSLIKRLLGSTGREKPRHRKLSDVDRALTSRIFRTLLEQLSVTWHDLAELDLSLLGIESQASNVQVAPLSEPTLALTIEARLERQSSTVMLLLPWRAIEGAADRLQGGDGFGDAPADPDAADGVGTAMSGVNVEMRAEVASIDMSVDAVLRVQPGDVLHLNTPAASGVTLYADSVPLYRAAPGRSGHRRAVQVTERLEGPR